MRQYEYEPWITPPVTGLAAAPPSPMRRAVQPIYARTIGAPDPLTSQRGELSQLHKVLLAVHAVVLVATAYHGYRRNGDSVLWGASWAAGAAACPSVTLAFALSQGFARPGRSE